ncbi:MAG: EI24 domain-containing protein, partial [Pseudomonadota bacterium]|nr:EI24 domain-containing protein [Pseudomonadota bacterium]
AALLGYFFWEPAVDGVRSTFEAWALLGVFFGWLDAIGAGGFRNVLAPLIVVTLAIPLCAVASLLVVAMAMTPAVVRLVAKRRFALLELRRGGGAWQSIAWSLGCTALALLALVVSVPLWFVPPLVLILPPLIWGWLTYRVLAFDVLAAHATSGERSELLAEHRWPLLGMGVVAGYLGAAPSLLWAVNAMTLVFAPILIVVSVWLYTLVFAFSSLWFTHYLLAALQSLRTRDTALVAASAAATTSAAPTVLLAS